ncbi:MAG: hypothetical protein ACW99F_14355 [Candidatus Hodarchaeales archaeon]|jgi:hypothetical protein
MYDYQTSDLIFEKVLDSDRTITRDPVVAFLEQNGNFYYQTPLMNLARTYHKTDDYGHTELIKQFTDVLQNYSIDESDDILTTLDTQKDNPRLLIILKNKIDGFTDKSPATTMGRLYSQMASNIVLADTLISRQERLSKRQFTNTKLIDRRIILLPNLEKKESNADSYLIADDSAFLPTPLISRNIFPFYNTDSIKYVSLGRPPADVAKHFKLQTNANYFFDYEKALNYKSNISKFINPYNIEQLFGKGSLANYFYFISCVVEKSPTNILSEPISSRTKLYSLIYTYPEESGFSPNFALAQVDKDPDMNYHRLEGSQGALEGTQVPYLTFEPSKKEELFSTLMQRGFDTHAGLAGYRISLFELNDYQAASKEGDYIPVFDFEDINLKTTITIRDNTMKFYDVFIRQKIFSLLEAITRYYNFASDFCSYNDIDNKFNDFFVQSIRNEFSEPYPWDEATFYYYAFLQMMLASQNPDQTRRREGVLLDLGSIREASIDRRKFITPETGNLDDLEIFRGDLEKLVQQYFTQDRGLDRNNEIYEDTRSTDNTYVLLEPSELIKFSRSDNFNVENISSDFNITLFNELDEYNLSRCAELFVKKEEIEEEINRLANLPIPMQPSPEMVSELEEINSEIEQRKCNEIPVIQDVMKCRYYAQEWTRHKGTYDSSNAQRPKNRSGMVDARRKMDDWLEWYQNSGCPELIGPIQESFFHSGNSDPNTGLEQDFKDAGVLE